MKVSVRVKEVSQSGLTHDLNLGSGLVGFGLGGGCGGWERENLMGWKRGEVGLGRREKGVKEKEDIA